MAFTVVQFIRMVAQNMPTSPTTVYTVPASRQDVIKSVDLCNTTAAAIVVGMSIAGVSLFNGLNVPPGQTVHWTGTLVMNAGEVINLTSAATGVHCIISGLESQ